MFIYIFYCFKKSTIFFNFQGQDHHQFSILEFSGTRSSSIFYFRIFWDTIYFYGNFIIKNLIPLFFKNIFYKNSAFFAVHAPY